MREHTCVFQYQQSLPPPLSPSYFTYSVLFMSSSSILTTDPPLIPTVVPPMDTYPSLVCPPHPNRLYPPYPILPPGYPMNINPLPLYLLFPHSFYPRRGYPPM